MLNSLLYASGVFSVALGVVHFFMPVLFDFSTAIPRDGSPLKPFRLLLYRYQTKRSDVLGLAWVMNHGVSYVLVTIGLLDLMSSYWLLTAWGWLLAAWIGGWWFLRSVSQLYLGKRHGDWLIMFWFAILALLHIVVSVVACRAPSSIVPG